MGFFSRLFWLCKHWKSPGHRRSDDPPYRHDCFPGELLQWLTDADGERKQQTQLYEILARVSRWLRRFEWNTLAGTWQVSYLNITESLLPDDCTGSRTTFILSFHSRELFDRISVLFKCQWLFWLFFIMNVYIVLLCDIQYRQHWELKWSCRLFTQILPSRIRALYILIFTYLWLRDT